MSTEQNKSIVRRWVEEGWNKRNTALIDQLFTPNFYQHETGPETVTAVRPSSLRSGLPVCLPRPAIHHRRSDRRRG